MSNLNPTVFVVDTDEAQRGALATAIHQAGWKPETFASADEFLARPPLLASSCVVLELDPQNVESLELLRRIAADRAHTPVIATSIQPDIPMTVRAMKAGAVEFLVKPVAEDDLLPAVGNALARSEALVCQEAELLELRRRYDGLSRREREVMERVVAGLLNKQVGAALGISEITVKAHRGRVMRKMGADSLATLVRIGLRLRLPAGPASGPLPFPSSLARPRRSGFNQLPHPAVRDATANLARAAGRR